jgi:predicted peroxiredoxin
MEKIINRLINDAVKGVDTYKNSGSTWLIFTENKQWVIELTKEGVLWYNYNFFNNLFKYVSMDVVDGQHYITKWVENNVIKKVKRTRDANNFAMSVIEDTIENGVRHTLDIKQNQYFIIEDTIQNGVKHTEYGDWEDGDERLDDIIQNGVKDTQPLASILGGLDIEDTIQNGVKHTRGSVNRGKKIEETIQNGVKKTVGLHSSEVTPKEIEKVIKETKTPGEDGDIVGVLDFMSDNNTNNLPQLIDDVIENGIKHTHSDGGTQETNVEDTIQNGVKETHWVDYSNLRSVEDTIQNGVKETKGINGIHGMNVVIENGIKSISGQKYVMMAGVEEIIQNGVKETISGTTADEGIIEDVIERGVKYTVERFTNAKNSETFSKKIEDVIQNGIIKTKPMDKWVNTERIVKNVINNNELKEKL